MGQLFASLCNKSCTCFFFLFSSLIKINVQHFLLEMEGAAARMTKPKLLRTPFSLLSNQDERQEQTPPTLLKNLTSRNNSHRDNFKIFQLPLKSTKENTFPFLADKDPPKTNSIPTPRLIDLRPILQLRQSTSKKEGNNYNHFNDKINTPKKVPQLIRLPNLHQEPQKKLLESPKRENPKKKRSKPKDPKLIDVRNEPCIVTPEIDKSKKEPPVQLLINRSVYLFKFV